MRAGHGEPARTTCEVPRIVAANPRRDDSRRRTGARHVEGDVVPGEAHTTVAESFVERELHDSDSTHGRTLRFSVKRTFSTRTALTLYLLIVSVITARTVALTLIKVQLNKTKTENNHFCLTGKMARYVAEAVTTHAPLAKHMFFRPELCAGLMHRVVGAAPPDSSTNFRRIRTNCR